MRKLLWLVLMVPGLCWAQLQSIPPWGSNPVTVSPDDVNCNAGGNHLTLAACIAYWSQVSNVQSGIPDTCATTGVQGVRLVSAPGGGGPWSYQGWWKSKNNAGSCGSRVGANYGGIGSPNNINFSGCSTGWTWNGINCALVQASDLTPVYVTAQNSGQWTPTVQFNGVSVPAADYTITYGDFQQTAQVMDAEFYLTLNTIPAGSTGPITISGLPCASATYDGGGPLMNASNFAVSLSASPVFVVSGTTAYLQRWVSTGIANMNASTDIKNGTAFGAHLKYLCQ